MVMPSFSTKTIVDVLPQLMDKLTNQEINVLLLRLALQNVAPNENPDEPGKFLSKKNRAFKLAKYLVENPTAKGCYESNLDFEVLNDLIGMISDGHDIANELPNVINSLKRDGYVIQEGRLRTLLPEELELPGKEDRIKMLLGKYGFSVAEGHYDQAINAYTRGDWAAANGQLRTFIQKLFDSIADELVLCNTNLAN